jgi:hypothetical protein
MLARVDSLLMTIVASLLRRPYDRYGGMTGK